MAYYDKVTSKALFAKYASAAESFDSLYQSNDFKTAVSSWGTAYLYASRVICAKPQKRLALFSDDYFPGSAKGVHEYIDRLVEGPTASLRGKTEHQIVQENGQPDSVGYVWAALARLQEADNADSQAPATTSNRAARETRTTQHFEYVSSATMQVGSSSPTRPGSDSDESMESIDWANKQSSAPLEELAVRLASRFIRVVVNYAQPTDKAFPVRFRDERLAHVFRNDSRQRIQAIDDGGLEIKKGPGFLQVATIEAKRAFQMFTNEGQPTVSDTTLGQLVGQALALYRTRETTTVAEEDHITILAVTHYIKFVHFHIKDDFIYEYEDPSPTADYLRVSSTEWFDISKRRHRKEVIKHILALLAWADENQGSYRHEPRNSGDYHGDSDDSMYS